MKGSKPLLSLAVVGMELSWRYAWATFLTLSLLQHPFPFPEAVGSFVLAAALTSVYHERGWRIILILCLQLLGFIPAAWRIIHVFSSWSGSFLTQAYQAYVGSFSQQGIPLGWIVVLLFLLWAFFFWGGGVSMAKRPRDYATLCSRFDLGLGAFFALFLIKFYLFLTGSKGMPDSSSEFLLFSFFIFGLLAIGLAKNRSGETKDFMPGYRGLGVILSFIMVVLLFGAGLIFFALPYLTEAARIGYGIMKEASGPFMAMAMSVLRFIFGDESSLSKHEPRPEKKPANTNTSSPSLDSWWLKLLGEIMTWIVVILLALILLTIIGVTLYTLVRWLFSKAEEGGKKQGLGDFLPLWTRKFRWFLEACRRAMARRVKPCAGALQLYAALLLWGRRSGLSRSLSETPAEYGRRLKYRFPALEGEIDVIVESFHREVYGETVIQEEQLAAARCGFRRLRSPLLWLARLQSRLRRNPDQDFTIS